MMYLDRHASGKYLTYDPEVSKIIQAEEDRQFNTIELIASENFASAWTRAAQGSIFTNKYAEGYPKHRYYGGCVNMDSAEDLAIKRITELFGCKYANVQPHAGCPANMAVYFALLKPGMKIMSMRLDQGGHLSHGSPVSFSGQLYNIVHYPLNKETEMIDYEVIEELATKEKPDLILCGASAYPRIIDFERIGSIAKRVGAISMADVAHIAGPIVAGLHPNPFPHMDVVTSTTHKTLRGPRGGIILTNDEEIIKKINKTIFPGIQGGPLMHVILAKAVAFGEALRPEFKDYQKRVLQNCKIFCDAMAKHGWRIVSGGTDNHLFLVDLRSHNVDGVFAQDRLDEVNITANRNGVPYDPNPPYKPSGMRFGTAAMTTRGFNGEAFIETARLVTDALLSKRSNEEIKKDVAATINKYCTN
jgi:glycine hydroxymethyltransferase